jgi:hypothetical protein
MNAPTFSDRNAQVTSSDQLNDINPHSAVSVMFFDYYLLHLLLVMSLCKKRGGSQK